MVEQASEESINVVVAMDFSDEIIEQLRGISPRLNIMRHYPDVPDDVWETVEVLYTLRHYPEPEAVPHLRWIQLHVTGADRALKRRIIQTEDVTVTTASGVAAGHMAEYCLAMMFAFAYRLQLLLDYQAKAEWPGFHEVAGHSLRGKTLGIAGYGSIGRELARLASGLGLQVLATKRDLKRPEKSEGYHGAGAGDPNAELPERLYPPEALASMASECDYLVLTLPLTEATRYSINEEIFEAMKPTAVLINVARGAVVDEKALISALAAEQIAGAALDVFEEEPLPAGSTLWNLDNVIITPHISGESLDYHRKVADLFAQNLRNYLENQPLLNKLDRARGY